jgi:hypothetical protein
LIVDLPPKVEDHKAYKRMSNLIFIAMVNYTTTTLSKQGTLMSGDVTYNVNVTAVNNELTRLTCSISKKDAYIGNITLEHGRKVIEIIQDESVIPHLTTFQEILDEVLGKPQTT